MKKNIFMMMLFAAAAIASVSCQKEETAPASEPVTLTFTSANPQTKTEWDGETGTIWWSEKDIIRVALKIGDAWYSDGSGAKLYQSSSLSSKSLTGEFSLKTFDSEKILTTGDYQFYSVYPVGVTETNFDPSTSLATINLPSVQMSSTSTFDKSADVLWGKAVNTYTQLPTENVPLLWNRLVAHAYITLKGINGIAENETINSVTLTAQEGAALTGAYDLNVATGEFTAKATSNVVTVNCTGISADESGNATFWACINPCEVTSLNIVVDTDVATYTIDKQNLNLAFLQNQRNILPVNMSAAVRVQKEVDDTDYSNDYLITGTKTDGTMVAAGAYVSGNNNINTIVGVTLTDGAFEYVDGLESCKMTVEKVTEGTYAGKYTIKDAYGNYLYAPGSGDNNYLKGSKLQDDAAYYWSISLNDDGTHKVVAAATSNNNELRYNRRSSLFSCYASTSSMSAITLYPYSMVMVSTTPVIVLSTEQPVAVGDEGGEVTISYTIKNPADGVALEASADADWLTDVQYADGTVTYTAAANEGAERTATVTLSYEGAADATVTITQAAKTTGDEPSTKGFALVTSLGEVTTGEYVIAAKVGDVYYAMNNIFDTSISGTEIPVSENLISDDMAQNYCVTITRHDSGVSIYNGSNYVGHTNEDSTSLTKPKSEYIWGLYMGSTGTFALTSNVTIERFFMFDTSSKVFKAYKTGSRYVDIEFFKKVTSN